MLTLFLIIQCITAQADAGDSSAQADAGDSSSYSQYSEVHLISLFFVSLFLSLLLFTWTCLTCLMLDTVALVRLLYLILIDPKQEMAEYFVDFAGAPSIVINRPRPLLAQYVCL